MTDAAGNEADQNLTRLRACQLDVLDDERLTELLEYRGLDPHAADPTPRVCASGGASRGITDCEPATHLLERPAQKT